MSQGDFWNKLMKRLKDVSSAAADFTEEQAIIGKLKFEILTLKRKIDKLHYNLGVRVSELSKLKPQPEPFKDKEVREFLNQIVDLEQQIEENRQNINTVAENFRAKAAAAKDESTEDADIEREKTTGKKDTSRTSDTTSKIVDKSKPKPKKQSSQKRSVTKAKSSTKKPTSSKSSNKKKEDKPTDSTAKSKT